MRNDSVTMAFTAESPQDRTSSPHGSSNNGCSLFRYVSPGPFFVCLSFLTVTFKASQWRYAMQKVNFFFIFL